MGWDQTGRERDREDRWTRSERWSGRAEGYREIMDTPEKVERMRREDAAYGGRVLVAIAFPLCVYLAHRLQRLTHHHGFLWTMAYVLVLFAVPWALFAAVRSWWNRR